MDNNASEIAPCDRRRILVTDDETPVREIFRMILASGFRDCVIDTAINGEAAVESFLQHHQGVILIDMKMPIMDGQTAIQKIREHCDANGWEKPGVIFCTGFTPSSSAQALPDQDCCIIQKPVTSDQLLSTVRSRLVPAS